MRGPEVGVSLTDFDIYNSQIVQSSLIEASGLWTSAKAPAKLSNKVGSNIQHCWM